jgi:hypothetical protein
MIDREAKDTLREILLADEPAWTCKLDAFLEPLSSDPMRALLARQFLKTRLAGAGPAYASRLEAMFARVGEAIRRMDPQNSLLDRLAERINELNAMRQDLDSELAEARQLTITLIGESGTASSRRFRVKTSRPGWTLRILDKDKIPSRWLAPQPDRKAILQHFKNTGEIIPGASVGKRQPSVYVSEVKPEDSPGDDENWIGEERADTP